MIKNSYVFEQVFGNDVLNEINQFIINPIKESIEIRNNSLLRELCNIYDNYCVFTQKKIRKLQKQLVNCKNYEFQQDIRESIADCHWNINCVTDYELMKFQPRVLTDYELMTFQPRVC